MNINIGPILAGAGVVGAALAFGAQNIVKDYLAGFFILLENQYTLGDVIKIGAVSGTVEDITMRITTLRAADGTLHIMPNGTIQAVSNMTCIWATCGRRGGCPSGAHGRRARAMHDVATALAQDVAWQHEALGPPEVTGVVAVDDISATLRCRSKSIAGGAMAVRFELFRASRASSKSEASPFRPACRLPPACHHGRVSPFRHGSRALLSSSEYDEKRFLRVLSALL